MATVMTSKDRDSLRQGLASGRGAEEIWVILQSESSGTLTQRTERTIDLACPSNSAGATSIKAALNAGTALTHAGIKACRNFMINEQQAARMITDLGNIS